MNRVSAVLLASLFAMPVYAQRFPAEGTPVRIRTDREVVEGTVQKRTRDSLWVKGNALEYRAFSRPEMWTISTYGTQRGRGAKRGAVIGGILGVVALGTSLWLDTHPDGECICVPLTFLVAPAAAAMPLVGAGIGAIAAPTGWSKPKPYY